MPQVLERLIKQTQLDIASLEADLYSKRATLRGLERLRSGVK